MKRWKNWKETIIPDEELGEAHAIIALSFGLQPNRLGLSNKWISIIVKTLYEKYHLPLVLQKEIADCLPDLDKVTTSTSDHNVFSGKYLDTHEVLELMEKFCRNQGYTRIILVAHPDHMRRVAKIAEKFGLSGYIPREISHIPYDPYSIQWWTRGKFLFFIREVPTRIFYKIRGWT